ncbi:MAG TPA: hypothetical protein VHT96_16330 [Clostridia bacterium]|nr:hypothetical protein [Clostridia bacterium]
MVDTNGMIRKQVLFIKRFADVDNTRVAVVTEAEGKVPGALA